MIKRLAVAAIAVIGIYSAVPASAEEIGVGMGMGIVVWTLYILATGRRFK